MERLCEFFVRKGCVMFLGGEVAFFSHSLTHKVACLFCVERLQDFF